MRRQIFVDEGVDPMLIAGRRCSRADGCTFLSDSVEKFSGHTCSSAMRNETNA